MYPAVMHSRHLLTSLFRRIDWYDVVMKLFYPSFLCFVGRSIGARVKINIRFFVGSSQNKTKIAYIETLFSDSVIVPFVNFVSNECQF